MSLANDQIGRWSYILNYILQVYIAKFLNRTVQKIICYDIIFFMSLHMSELTFF